MPEPTEEELRAAARENELVIQTTKDKHRRLEGQITNQRIYDALERMAPKHATFSTASPRRRPAPKFVPERVPSMSEEESAAARGPSDDELREAARVNEQIIQTTSDSGKRLQAQTVTQRIYDELDRRGRTRERGMMTRSF